MNRVISLLLILALAAGVAAGGSWALAYHGVADLLGDPPPQMGSQTTRLLWDGYVPREWDFAFGPTLIPGAPYVRIHVSPLGRVQWTEPADLADRVKVLHDKGY